MRIHSIVLLLLLLTYALAAPEEEKVNAIKGYYDFTSEFSMYSGYL